MILMPSRLTLFDDILRTDHSYSAEREPAFDFLNRSAWPASYNMRMKLEQWFQDYPEGAKSGLRARFRRPDDNHGSAFFELLLYQIFLRLGLSPKVEPTPQKGRGRPDFAIKTWSGAVYYVEANVAGLSGHFPEDPLRDEVLDAINQLAVQRPTQISLEARTRGRLRQSPSLSSIKKKVWRWLEQIDPAEIVPYKTNANPHIEIRRGDWVLKLTALRLLPRVSTRLIHVYPEGETGNDGETLRKNILEKAKQHGALEHPLIIVMNTQQGFQSSEDEMSALFGEEQVTWQEDERGNATPAFMSRRPDGVWRKRSGIRYRRLHGVLFFRGVRPWNADSVPSYLYVNPYLETEVPDELLRLGSASVQNGEMKWEAGMRLGELLDLPKDWPGERTVPPGLGGTGGA